MKKIFAFPFSKWLYRWLHPDIGVRLAQYLSVKNKLISGDEDKNFLGDHKEWLALYAKKKLETKHFDYFIFGHRHLPLEIKVGDNSTYFNLGDFSAARRAFREARKDERAKSYADQWLKYISSEERRLEELAKDIG